MSNDLKKHFCPRLIDFVIIVGCKEPQTPSQLIAKHLLEQQENRKHYEDSLPPEFHHERYKTADNNGATTNAQAQQQQSPLTQMPELLRRYPLDDHKDFMLPQDVTYFCQPEGTININCSNQHKANSHKDSTSFIFSLTEKDSSRVRYGVCINFFRPIEKRHEQKRRQRQKEKRANRTKSDDDESDDEHAPDATTGDKQIPNSSSNSSRLSEVKNKDSPISSRPGSSLRKRRAKKASEVKYTHTLTSLCIISHHPFFSIFRECLSILRRIIEACHARSQASKPGTPSSSSTQSIGQSASASSLTKLQRDTVWGILTGSSGTISTEQISSLIACEIREIETWILRLLSAPVPIPGKTKLIIDILPNESPMLFALPDHTRFDLVDFPLHLPLELLGVDVCIQVITLILLEHKVLFQSSDYNALTMSIMALISMLYPLEYMFPIIPLLPRVMKETEQLLLAPTPFIIGVPSNFLQYRTNFQLPDDVWLVDLDRNKIFPARGCEPIPDLPEPEHSILRRNLNQVLASLSCSPQPVKNFEGFFKEQSTTQMNRSDQLDKISKSFNPLMYGNDVDSVDVATRITMVQFLTSKNVLGNFSEHTRTLRLYPRPVVAFQYNSFLRSRPTKSKFITQLGRSQAVEFLAEWSLCPNNVAYLRIQTGVFDPSLIGDKAKWYCRYLSPIQFKTYEEKTTLAAAIQFYNQEHSKTFSPEFSLTDDSISSEPEDLDSFYNSYSSNTALSSSDTKEAVPLATKLPEKAPVFTTDGRPLGMFPKNQATTMCVDVVSVYTPPVDSGFKLDPSESLSAESSAMTSSVSNSSSISSIAGNGKSTNEANATTTGSRDAGESASSCVTDSEHAQDIDEEEEDPNESIFIDEKIKPTTDMASPTVNKVDSDNSSTPINKKSTSNHSSTGQLNAQDAISLTAGVEKLKRQTLESQSSTTTLNENKPSEALEQGSKKKTSSLSLLSQLSDVVMSDVAAKAKNFATSNYTKKRFPSFRNTPETEHIPRTDVNNNIPLKQHPSVRMNTVSVGLSSLAKPEKDLVDIKSLPQSQSIQEINNDNQQFLKEVLANVLDGLGVGWLKFNRVRRLMEDENNRNFVLSRLNTSLDNKLLNDEQHIEDVKVTKAVFKGMSKLLATIVYGLEQTYANNGLGGMASAFQLLEIAHTHYWCQSGLETTRSSSQGDGAMSPMSEHSGGSPYDSHENLDSVTNMNQSVRSSASSYSLNQPVGPKRDVQNFEIQSTGSVMTQLDPQKKTSISMEASQIAEGKEDVFEATTAAVDQSTKLPASKPLIKHHVINPQEITTSDALPSISPSLSVSSSIKNQDASTSSLSLASTAKSQVSSGYRYTKGCLVEAPTHIKDTTLQPSTVKVEPRTYLFETLINKSRSTLWDQMQFWEDVFLDAVSQERDIIGLDQGPSEMMERYNMLGGAEKKRLELDEDHLLAVMLYNLISFMIMMKVKKDEVKRKIRRMLGKCHIGLSMSQQVNDLLDCVNYLSGNDVDIRPAGSRLMQKQSFTVHLGTDNKSDMLFMEVCDDCIILRSVKGEICERWFFEKLVNMTYCPKTKNICLWCKQDGETKLNKFYTKKCRELYYSIKEAMEKAVSRLNDSIKEMPCASDLEGDFPISDLETGETGVLQVSMGGIGLNFETKKDFVELKRVRKCTTQKDDVFVLEEFDPKIKKIVVRKFNSPMPLAFVNMLSGIPSYLYTECAINIWINLFFKALKEKN